MTDPGPAPSRPVWWGGFSAPGVYTYTLQRSWFEARSRGILNPERVVEPAVTAGLDEYSVRTEG